MPNQAVLVGCFLTSSCIQNQHEMIAGLLQYRDILLAVGIL